jgi:flagellar FliJ protein
MPVWNLANLDYMKRSARMQRLLKLAENRERESAHALHEAERQLDVRQDLLSRLETYLADYLAYPSRSGQTISNPMLMNNLHGFLKQLELARKDGVTGLGRARDQYMGGRQRWLDDTVRKNAIRHIVDKMIESELRAYERLQQKQLDEHGSGRRFRRDA